MAKKANEPGRFKQIIDVFKRTVALDKAALWWMILGFTAPIIAAVTAGIVLKADLLSWILWSLLGLTLGFMLALIILGRRAEKAAYLALDGRPGAVGAVLRAPLKRSFRGTEEPVAINPRSYSAVYRIVGAPGIVLIAEGNRADAQQLLEAERKKAARAATGVPIHAIWVTTDGKGTPLNMVVKTLNKMKRKLNRNEIRTVQSRLVALTAPLPIPKGIDPRKVRAARR